MRKLTILRRNLNKIWGAFFDYFMKFLYFGGIQASIIYGLYTKPPLLMHAWYQMTGDAAQLEKMNREMMQGGGMMWHTH